MRWKNWQTQALLRFIINYFSLQYEFLTSFLNIIDLLGILPFYLSLSLNLLSSQYSLEYIAKAAQIFRILRILRIFKLSRHITGLKTLGTTLRNSHRYVRCTNLVRNRVISMFKKKNWQLPSNCLPSTESPSIIFIINWNKMSCSALVLRS